MSARTISKCGASWMASLLLSGCGGDVATHPHAASAGEHERAAEHADTRVRTAESGPNPFADCLSRRDGICWSQSLNVRRERERDIEFYRQLAARHRAAVAALRGAEEGACAGIGTDDRDISPFFNTADIIAVDPLRADATAAEASAALRGAVIVFRPVPGLSEESLRRSVECHLARAAVLGHDVPELSFCPLMPRGVDARVSAVERGFPVEVSSKDRRSAEEIWQRAARLVESGDP